MAPRIVRTQREVAETLGVSPRTVRLWRQRGMPRRPDGRYDLSEIRRWRQEHVGGVGGSKTAVERLREVTIRYREVRTELEKIKLQRERGELVSLEEAARDVATRLRDMRRRLEAIPLLADRLVGCTAQEIRRVLAEEVNDALSQLQALWS